MPRRTMRRKRRMRPRNTLNVSQKKTVKRMINSTLNRRIEDKHISSNSGIVSVTDVPAVYGGVLPIVGSDVNQRIGDKIRLTAFLFKYTIYLSDPSNVMRIIVFQWKNNSFLTGTPTASNILQVTTPYPWLSQLNQDLKAQMHVLYDKTHTMQNGGPLQITRSVNIRKFGVRNLEFLSGVATVNNTVRGEIYVLLVSDSSLTTHPTFIWRYMIKYQDA